MHNQLIFNKFLRSCRAWGKRLPGTRAILLFLFGVLFSGPSPVQARSPFQFVVDNQTFAYNLEWTGIDTIADGQTFIGNILKTYFQYHFHPRLFVQGGALLQHPFGDDRRISETDPVISLNYRLFPGWLVTAGTIDRNHPLHDGIFWETLRFTDPIEQGFQIKADTEYLRQDTWISWEQRETATRREKFSVGNYTGLKYRGFNLDGQIYWVHLGGQQNNGPGVFNNLSMAFGGGYTWKPGGEQLSFLNEAGFRAHYLYQKDEPFGMPKVDEDGVALRAWVELWGFNLFFGLWDGGSQNFNSGRGDIAQPGIALAKGNPLYRAQDFQEVGLYKIIHLADSVSARLDLRQQFVLDELVEVYALTVQWVEAFDLFEDYFRRHWKGWRSKSAFPSRLKKTPSASRLKR